MYYQRKDLSAAEKAKPYAKYYYREPKAPAPDKLAAMEKPIDPSQALKIEDRNDLLNPGYLETEAGWCVMPDGSAYVANYTEMPGVTIDMFLWWMAWHALEPMRYKIWYRPSHYHVQPSPVSRRRLLDDNLPIKERVYDVSHYVIEDIGNGPELIWLDFISAEEMGFDMARFKAPNVAGLIASRGQSKLANVPAGEFNPKGCATMCHFLREVPGGLELRTRFWMGKKIFKGEVHHLLPEGVALPPIVPQGLAIHNVLEFTNLASFLPEIYRENEGAVFE